MFQIALNFDSVLLNKTTNSNNGVNKSELSIYVVIIADVPSTLEAI